MKLDAAKLRANAKANASSRRSRGAKHGAAAEAAVLRTDDDDARDSGTFGSIRKRAHNDNELSVGGKISVLRAHELSDGLPQGSGQAHKHSGFTAKKLGQGPVFS